MAHSLVIGVDIGGSHITCMAVDLHLKQLMHQLISRKPVDSRGSAESILDAWIAALDEVIRMMPAGNFKGIGFAMPGPFDYPTGVALFEGVQKFDSLYGLNIGETVRIRLSLPDDVPVRFLNDATCFAIGETWMGDASAFERTVVITLGTGFGSAFLANGIPVEAGDEVPTYGCVYHLPFGSSIADDHFSSRWFRQRYERVTGMPGIGVKEMSEQATTDAAIRDIFTEFGENLGRFMVPWLIRFGAGCLTIGGNIAKGYPLFEEPFRAALESHHCSTRIFLSSLGECAAIAGSARLTDDTFYHRLPFISNK